MRATYQRLGKQHSFHDLIGFFELLKWTKKASAAIDAGGRIKFTDIGLREDVDYFASMLEHKAGKVLGDIEASIEDRIQKILQLAEESAKLEIEKAENLCHKTLDLVEGYGEHARLSWKPRKQEIILRKLLDIYSLQGDLVQIYPVLKRLQGLPHVKLADNEKSLFAKSYETTSAVMKPLLSKYEINIDEDQSFCGSNLFPAVNRAIEDGDRDVTQVLLKKPTTTPEVDILMRSPVHIAASSAKLPLVQEVIKAYPREINSRDVFQRTPLHYAACAGDLENFKAFHANGANVHDRDKQTHSVLSYAAGVSHEITKHVVEDLGIKPNKDPFGNALGPLHRATDANHVENVQLLLKHGAKDYPSLNGKTALQMAKEKNFVKCIAALSQDVSESANPDAIPLLPPLDQSSLSSPNTYMEDPPMPGLLSPSGVHVTPQEYSFAKPQAQAPFTAWSSSPVSSHYSNTNFANVDQMHWHGDPSSTIHLHDISGHPSLSPQNSTYFEPQQPFGPQGPPQNPLH
ncbi:MAG: hypothetical protein Q9227_009510 [Pyrenula ochraceoflavens]